MDYMPGFEGFGKESRQEIRILNFSRAGASYFSCADANGADGMKLKEEPFFFEYK